MVKRFRTRINTFHQESFSTVFSATRGISSKTCWPERTVNVPSRWPLLTGAFTSGSRAISIDTAFFWPLSTRIGSALESTAPTDSSLPMATGTDSFSAFGVIRA